MYDRILFPTDGSDIAQDAVAYALALAGDVDAELIALNVADTSKISYTRIQSRVIDAHVRQGEAIVEEVAQQAATTDVEVTTDVVQGRPDESIVAYAHEYDVDVIVMPTRGREGLGQHVLGSVTERVLRRADVPVLTISPAASPNVQYPHDTVLVPVDDSDPANRAIDRGVNLASYYGGSLHLVHVVESGQDDDGLLEVGDDIEIDREDLTAEILRDASERVPASFSGPITSERTRGETVPAGIREYVADHEIDIVVMGTHGRTGLDQYVVGSTTEGLVRTSSVPVMVVP